MNQIIDAIMNEMWAMTPGAFRAMLDIIDAHDPRHPAAGGYNPDHFKVMHASGIDAAQALAVIGGEPIEGTRQALRRGSVGIVPVLGPIFPRANLFTEISGATSVETLMRDISAVMSDPRIDTLILNIDSPGGAITGISELSAFIAGLRDKKKVYAYVSGQSASAAYWIASGASEIVSTDTGLLGSIGVIAIMDRPDEKTKAREISIVSSQSPNKRPDIETTEGRAKIQAVVDNLADVFIGAVAKNRGTSVENVIQSYGQGDVMIAQKAISAGMADRIGTLDELINEKNQSTNKPQGGFFMSGKPETATEAVIHTITVEGVREGSPETFEAIQKIGFEAGVVSERERIQAVENIKAPGFETLIAAHKFDAGMTREKMAVMILDAQEAKRTNQAAAQTADAAALETATAGIDTRNNETATANAEENVAADRIAAAGSKRNEKK